MYQSNISFTKFAFLKLSRLYPLHLLTLLLVAAIQLYSANLHQVAVGDNDAYHFFLNLFFVSAWELDNSLSYNIPAWSVSVEIFFIRFIFYIVLVYTQKIIFIIDIIASGPFHRD
ncbi:MAG: hypothetical protein H7Z20_10680 [Bdellovibrio sp.]|nr:hypothetical protein [Methylotenera sp.]